MTSLQSINAQGLKSLLGILKLYHVASQSDQLNGNNINKFLYKKPYFCPISIVFAYIIRHLFCLLNVSEIFYFHC